MANREETFIQVFLIKIKKFFYISVIAIKMKSKMEDLRQHAVKTVLRHKFTFAYSVLALLVLWAWWANVISVYLKASSSDASTAGGEEIINGKALADGADKVVVLSCYFELYTVPSHCLFKKVCGCSYWLPVSVLAWRRLGYKALVLTVGIMDGDLSWKQRDSYHFTLAAVAKIGGVQIEHIEINQETFFQDMDSLVPLFATKFLRAGNPYVIFSPVNFFPLSQSYFEPTSDREKGVLIVSTKSRCCRRFLLAGNVIKLLPDGTMVGMLASTWRDVMGNWTSDEEETGTAMKQLHNKYIGKRNLNQIRGSSGNVILSILINEWLRSRGDIAKGIEKSLLTIRQPPIYTEKPNDDVAGMEEEAENTLFHEFPIHAQTIAGWSEVYPVAADLFDPFWLDLTEYWINFTNVVNAEPNIHPKSAWASATASILENGVRFYPLIMTPPTQAEKETETDVAGNYQDRQDDFQYVAFFDEDE